jgi:serine/threonine-protein kinase RsbW
MRTAAARWVRVPGVRGNGPSRVRAVTSMAPAWSIFAGSPDQVRQVRSFISRSLQACPVADDAALLASELATNAVRHTASGRGGTFAVTVRFADNWARVEVQDEGSARTPAARSYAMPCESGYGLGLVDLMATRWGHEGGIQGRVVWFELEWK